jgi:vacuolar protein sorting-associated protein 72
MAEEDVDTPMRSVGASDLSSDDEEGTAQPEEQQNSTQQEKQEDDEQVEWLATGRERRATAGNRLSTLLQQEGDDDELELLFAEDEDDAGFEMAEDESDVQMDSSDDEDEGPAAGADDLEGEKEIERQEKAERQSRKRRINDGLPPAFRKKIKVNPTTLQATPPRPKKKSERASWIPTPDDAPVRASSRGTTKKSKEHLYAQMIDREARRLRQLETMQKAAKKKEAEKPKQLTQEDRLAEAARVEKKNAKSLNRWEEAEKLREEEQRAKLAALNNRRLNGPVITWWSGKAEWLGERLKLVGKIEVEEPKEKPSVARRKKADMLTTSVPSTPAPATAPSTTTVGQPTPTANVVPTSAPANSTPTATVGQSTPTANAVSTPAPANSTPTVAIGQFTPTANVVSTSAPANATSTVAIGQSTPTANVISTPSVAPTIGGPASGGSAVVEPSDGGAVLGEIAATGPASGEIKLEGTPAPPGADLTKSIAVTPAVPASPVIKTSMRPPSREGPGKTDTQPNESSEVSGISVQAGPPVAGISSVTAVSETSKLSPAPSLDPSSLNPPSVDPPLGHSPSLSNTVPTSSSSSVMPIPSAPVNGVSTTDSPTTNPNISTPSQPLITPTPSTPIPSQTPSIPTIPAATNTPNVQNGILSTPSSAAHTHRLPKPFPLKSYDSITVSHSQSQFSTPPPPVLDGSAPLPGFLDGIRYNANLPGQPRMIPSSTTPFAFTPAAQPPKIEHSVRNVVILENFDENALRDKQTQCKVLMGKKFPKVPSKYRSTWTRHKANAL